MRFQGPLSSARRIVSIALSGCNGTVEPATERSIGSCAIACGSNTSGPAGCRALWLGIDQISLMSSIFLDVYARVKDELALCTAMCQQPPVTRAALQQWIALPADYDADQLYGVIESTARSVVVPDSSRGRAPKTTSQGADICTLKESAASTAWPRLLSRSVPSEKMALATATTQSSWA
jgi:hypothetical protein